LIIDGFAPLPERGEFSAELLDAFFDTDEFRTIAAILLLEYESR